MKTIAAFFTIGSIAIMGSGCATMEYQRAVRQAPIHNPFDNYNRGTEKQENVVLRTKKGDRAVEIELPGNTADSSEFVLPVNPAFQEGNRGPASINSLGMTDEGYRDRAPGISDREITNSLPQGTKDAEGQRRDIENGLGLSPLEESAPAADKSYLALLDHVKQLYKTARYEAALLELDEMVRAYPTDSKLYEMRGTLFERTGRVDLALKSWNQSLRLDPENQSLRRFVERKQQKRSVASP